MPQQKFLQNLQHGQTRHSSSACCLRPLTFSTEGSGSLLCRADAIQSRELAVCMCCLALHSSAACQQAAELGAQTYRLLRWRRSFLTFVCRCSGLQSKRSFLTSGAGLTLRCRGAELDGAPVAGEGLLHLMAA